MDTKSQLKAIIQEEVRRQLQEADRLAFSGPEMDGKDVHKIIQAIQKIGLDFEDHPEKLDRKLKAVFWPGDPPVTASQITLGRSYRKSSGQGGMEIMIDGQPVGEYKF